MDENNNNVFCFLMQMGNISKNNDSREWRFFVSYEMIMTWIKLFYIFLLQNPWKFLTIGNQPRTNLSTPKIKDTTNVERMKVNVIVN